MAELGARWEQDKSDVMLGLTPRLRDTAGGLQITGIKPIGCQGRRPRGVWGCQGSYFPFSTLAPCSRGGKFWLSALIGRARVGGRVNISLLFFRPLSHSPPKGEGSMLGQNWVLFGHIHSMTMSLTACLCPPKIYVLKPSSPYSRI